MLRMSYSVTFGPSVCLLTLSNDNSSKAIETICPYLSKNVTWVEGFKNAKIMVIFLFVWLPWQQKAPIDL